MGKAEKLEERFSVIIEDPDGRIEIDNNRYHPISLAAVNPSYKSDNDLACILRILDRQQKKDGKQRLLVRYKRNSHGNENGDIELVSVVPIGPVDKVMASLRAAKEYGDDVLPEMTPPQRDTLVDTLRGAYS